MVSVNESIAPIRSAESTEQSSSEHNTKCSRAKLRSFSNKRTVKLSDGRLFRQIDIRRGGLLSDFAISGISGAGIMTTQKTLNCNLEAQTRSATTNPPINGRSTDAATLDYCTSSTSDRILDSLTEPSFLHPEMDCEGFQDLRNWCDPFMDDLNTPLLDKEKAFTFGPTTDTYTPNDTSFMRSPTMWDMFTSADDPCDSAVPLPTNIEAVKNQSSVNIEDMPIIFTDLPRNEDSVEIVSNGQVFMGAEGVEPPSVKEESWERPVMPKIKLENCETPSPVDKYLTTADWHTNNSQDWHTNNSQYHTKPFNNMKNLKNLHLDVTKRYDLSQFQTLGPIVTTPDVLLAVEQLEDEKLQYPDVSTPSSTQELILEDIYAEEPSDNFITEMLSPPETPKFFQTAHSPEATRKRRNSDDSDESYVPPSKRRTSSAPKRRKASTSLSRSVLDLEVPKRKGRPPKRRESMASTCTNTDDNVSNLSIEELRYRELRDKNNEASRRSRMNRKLKEKEFEKTADELMERNQILTVQVDTLTKRVALLKEALLNAMKR